MQKRIITLLCAVGLALSAPVMAQMKLRPDAPARYEVKSGDTLWGISGKYLYQPWQWPKLWGANRAIIRNPHLIYPGQVLVLHYVDGQPRLGFEGGSGGIPTIKLTPRVREVSSGYGIATINVNFYRMFMQHPQIIDQMQTQNAPRLVAGPDNRLLYSKGDRVYADGVTEPGKYLVYRAVKDVLDPDTGKYLGQEVVFSGELMTQPVRQSALEGRSDTDAKYLKEGEYYTRLHPLLKVPTETAQALMVTEAVSEIRNGDYLLKVTDEGDAFNMMPHAPEKAIDAKIVSVMDGIMEAGPYQTITLNKGSADGLDKGSVLSLYKRSKQIRTRLEDRPGGSKSVMKYLSIPAEEVGLAMVYRAGEHVSSAIILDAKTNVQVGDLVTNPGHDLDDLPYNYEHAPNTPQDPHNYKHEQFDFRSNIKH